MSIFGKPMKQDLEVIRKAAVDTVQKYMRAEAKAQAKIAMKELADQMNLVLTGHGGIRQDMGNLATQVQRLIVMTDVLRDAWADTQPAPDEAIKNFCARCDRKRLEYTVAAGKA